MANAVEKFRTWVIGLSGVVIVAGLGFWFYVSSSDSSITMGHGRLKPVDFTSLDYEPKDPGYLLCNNLCKAADADGSSPILTSMSRDVRQILADMGDQMPGVQIRNFDLAINQFDYTERLPGETFPTVISIRLEDMELGLTLVTIYSYKPVGDSDDLDHKARVERWVEELKERTNAATP